MTSRDTFADAFLRNQCNVGITSCLNPSAESLLSEDTSFQFTRRKFRISPYEVSDTPFQNVSPSIIIESCPVSPRAASPPRDIEMISVDNYNPRSRVRQFTEPLTIEAIGNLGIRQSDLFFPTKAELRKIAGNRAFFKARLIERALKFADDVRRERERIVLAKIAFENEEPKLETAKSRVSPPRPKRKPMANHSIEKSSSDIKFAIALERAREMEEKEMEAKRALVENRDRRHEQLLKGLAAEKLRELEAQREQNEERRRKGLMFNERTRAEQTKRIWEYEAEQRRSKTCLLSFAGIHAGTRLSKSRNVSPRGHAMSTVVASAPPRTFC